jgi:AcrR family transcriptional regulator
MASTATERVDPRCTRSKQRVLTSAVVILREHGLPGLTFEAVAARSGVAKSTIYRHFPDRAALHLAAVESVGPSARMPCTEDVVDDLVHFLTGLNRTLHHSDFGLILLTALDGAERNDDLGRLAVDAAAQRRRMVTERLHHAQTAGGLRAEADLDLVCSQLVGPLFYRRFISRQATSAAFVAALVRGVITPLQASISRR